MQETTGSLIDVAGVVNLAPTGSLLNYRGSVNGWSSKAVGVLQNSVGVGWGWKNTTTVPAPQNPGSSVVILGYIQVDLATGGTAGIIEYQSGGSLAMRMASVNLPQLRMNGGTAAGTHIASGSVIPFVLSWDRTNQRVIGYTDKDKMVGVWGAITGIGMGFGATLGNNPVSSSYLYGSMWTGSDAETFTSGNVKTMMTTLGWSPTWT
jgi:hypothetical protein